MIWARFVALAAVLVGQESEAAKRSAINRAYYGVFNVARRMLEARGTAIDDHRAHSQVWQTLKAADGVAPEADVRWQRVGDSIAKLRDLRIQADYVDEVSGLDRKAMDAVQIALATLVLLDQLEFS